MQLVIFPGGGSGIGRAICEKLAANGARLIVVDVCRQSADDTANYLQKQQQSCMQVGTI